MLHNLLLSLIHRARRPDTPPKDVASEDVREHMGRSVHSETFQPIRSQEEIHQEEASERANSKRKRVISRILDDATPRRIRSRPSRQVNEAP